MSVSSVSSTAPQFQAAIAAKTRQPPEGTEPPAEKALDATNTQIDATLGAISSGLDISA